MSIESLLGRIKKLPSKDYLNECFTFNKEGYLLWKVRPESHFADKHIHAGMNKKYAGTKAGCDMGNGYYAVSVNSERYKLHRIIYHMMIADVNGITHIDHKNGNPSDNRLDNLRTANASQNAVNFKGYRGDSKSLARGVSWNAANKKWEAYAYKGGKRYQAGLFLEKVDALKSAHSKRVELFGEYWTSQNGN